VYEEGAASGQRTNQVSCVFVTTSSALRTSTTQQRRW
jgi:hypothetical protein